MGPTTRRHHSRAGLRYETDLTDAGDLNGIFHLLPGGIAWRLLPKDLPPETTVFDYFSRWRDAGEFRRINHHLVMRP